ncbi:GNAT family N-acetyltransferase [Aestuariicoccus sp. MJ-SS9]|uniref:GNAT family N-acetyltransferase n=1 Tax=Aestuariicoccus sp. MJ-SS9 TaxID=3079855 RepID=UPI00290E11CC|nr:GNAT family N-acetyltransferase [Aestuariicoccus sp. MJ-SS9]MDU8910217.1 GNAT family N-acetyltransferase [Aestuariicoccus sp. MJ-SS9]
MPLTIHPVSPRDPRAVALLEESHALMAALFPAEENFALDIDALEAPGIVFFGAENDGQLLGCAALMRCDGYAEIKSMFVASEARGIGVARRMLVHLEDVARAEGIGVLRLETGHKLPAAVQLYEASGFVQTGPFGAYPENPSSVFYEKSLGAGR